MLFVFLLDVLLLSIFARFQVDIFHRFWILICSPRLTIIPPRHQNTKGNHFCCFYQNLLSAPEYDISGAVISSIPFKDGGKNNYAGFMGPSKDCFRRWLSKCGWKKFNPFYMRVKRHFSHFIRHISGFEVLISIFNPCFNLKKTDMNFPSKTGNSVLFDCSGARRPMLLDCCKWCTSLVFSWTNNDHTASFWHILILSKKMLANLTCFLKYFLFQQSSLFKSKYQSTHESRLTDINSTKKYRSSKNIC